MIAAVIQKTSGLGNFSFDWFDLVLVGVLAFGFWRGRKNGMTKEFLPVTKWVVLVAACTLGYAWLGGLLIRWGVIHSVFGTMFREKTAALIAGYLVIALLGFIIFSFIKKAFKEKVGGSNFFGSGEYYLGMISGMVRYACMLVFFLALLNAPVYSLADIQARKDYNNHWYGGGLQGNSGNFIPSLDQVQADVFKNSLFGPFIKNNLGVLLINATGVDQSHPAAQKQPVIHIGN